MDTTEVAFNRISFKNLITQEDEINLKSKEILIKLYEAKELSQDGYSIRDILVGSQNYHVQDEELVHQLGLDAMIEEEIEGMQMTMCSEQETTQRIGFNTVSLFETKEPFTDDALSNPKEWKPYKPLFLKSYNREANLMPIRPLLILSLSTDYLINDILCPTLGKSVDLDSKLYSFCSDRFRAIAQDITISGDFLNEYTRGILRKMARFYILMGWYMHDREEFDGKLNLERLTQALTMALQADGGDGHMWKSRLMLEGNGDGIGLIEVVKQSFELVQRGLEGFCVFGIGF